LIKEGFKAPAGETAGPVPEGVGHSCCAVAGAPWDCY